MQCAKTRDIVSTLLFFVCTSVCLCLMWRNPKVSDNNYTPYIMIIAYYLVVVVVWMNW